MPIRSESGRPIVYLHIGAIKTGTTYLQQVMYANRDALSGAGLVVPGKTWGHQVRGVQDVLELGRSDRHIGRRSQGAWQELLDEALAAPQVSVISMEFLSGADRHRARQVVRTLADAEVRVVLTVRDMVPSLPSQWQTLVHNNGTSSWPEFLAAVPEPTERSLPFLGRVRPLAAEFHRTQNVARILRVWTPLVGPGSLHVVTVPRRPSAPDELWQRFASVMGVDPSAATRPPVDTNPSLGHASSELLRRLNLHLGPISKSEYNWTVKEPVAIGVLARRSSEEGKAQLTPDAYDLALRWNALTRRVVAAAGAPVTGDLEDLPTVPDPRVRASLPQVPAEPGTAAMLDAAEVALAAFARHARRRARSLARAGVTVDLAERPPVATLRAEWEAAEDPAEAAAVELADRAQENAVLLRRIRAVRDRGTDV